MKTYTITIQKLYGEYIVLGNDGEKGTIITFGKTHEEAIDNLADAIMTNEGIKVSWWNKLLNKLKHYE